MKYSFPEHWLAQLSKVKTEYSLDVPVSLSGLDQSIAILSQTMYCDEIAKLFEVTKWTIEKHLKALKVNYKKRSPGGHNLQYTFQYHNQTYTISQLLHTPEAQKHHLNYFTLWIRLVKCNWSVERAITTIKRGCQTFLYQGKPFTTKQLSQTPNAIKHHLDCNILRMRLKYYNWSVERSINTPIRKKKHK